LLKAISGAEVARMIVTRALPAVLLILLTAPIAQAQQTLKPAMDSAARCGVFALPSTTRPYPHLKWSGACRDGLAEGKGTASFAANADARPNKIWEGNFRNGFFVGQAVLKGRVLPMGDRAALVELPSNAAQEGSLFVVARLSNENEPLAICGGGVGEIAVEAPHDLAPNDEPRLRRMMQRAALAYRSACPSPLGLRFAIVAAGKRDALAVGSFGGATDVIARGSLVEGGAAEAIHDFRNIATNESDQGRRAQANKDRRQEQRADSRKAWQEFTRASAVAFWVTPKQLDTNPFRYDGKIVAFPARFVRMVAPNTAILRDDRWGEVMVSGIPNDLLQDKSIVVIAGRSSGRKAAPSGREISSVNATAWKLCQRAGCADYLDWIDEEKRFTWGEDQSEFLR
jgi:hypothetical protein